MTLVIIIIFAAFAGYAGWSSTHGEAQSHTSLLVVPPSSKDASAPSPVTNLTERTAALASALVVALHTDETANYVAAGGATAFTATNISDNLPSPVPSSVIQFEATGPDESTAHAGTQRLIDQTTQILTKMQIEAAIGQQTDMARLQTIVPPEETMSVFANQRIRAAAGFAIATFLTGALLYGGIAIFLERWRLRSHGAAGTLSVRHGDDVPEGQRLDLMPPSGLASDDVPGHHLERS